LGLRKTLIVTRVGQSDYAVSRIKRLDNGVELAAAGNFSSDHVPRIGRVGIAEPLLGISWHNSMPFYGKWFDDIGETDVGLHLRRNLSSLSQQRMLEQVKRDEQYALIGSYYSVFRTIMEAKKRVPLVLIDDSFLALSSFPVVLPRIDDSELERTLLAVLSRMLKRDPPNAAVPPPEVSSGIEVDEG
jgi:hypothetical protein